MAASGLFAVADSVIFAGSLLAALLIGVYYAFKDKKDKTLENYYYGGRQLSPIPIGVSMAVTFISSLTVIGMPEMAYQNGSIVCWMSFASLVQLFPAYLYFIPFLHRLKMSSVYEYLELRFHPVIRKLCSFVSILNNIMWMGMAVFLTAMALNVVSPLSVNLSILLTCAICTLYTVIGGMKAVVWVDFFQSFVMVGGCLAILVKTTVDVGGFGKVWESLERGNRANFWTLNPDPTFTISAWTILIGMGVGWSSVPCCNQAIIQRIQSCRSVGDAKKALAVFAVPLFILLLNAALNGMSMYAYFEGCDPLKAGQIKDKNQYIPFLVVHIFRSAPGMAGIFVSAAYSGMLSSVSSGMNALSNLILEDFVRPYVRNRSANYYLMLGKLFATLIGISIVGATYIILASKDSVMTFAITIDGAMGGPIFGLFVAGLFLPWISTKGAAIGFTGSILFNLTILMGARLYGPRPDAPTLDVAPHTTLNCSAADLSYNLTTTATYEISTLAPVNLTTAETPADRPRIADTLFSLSYMYYSTIGTFTCVVFSLLASLLTGASDPGEMDPKLFQPLVDGDCWSESVRRFFRFGVRAYHVSRVDHSSSSVSKECSADSAELEMQEKKSFMET